MRLVRLGLLGCADIALRRVLPAAAHSPGLRLTAVASRDPGKAAAAAAGFGGEPVTGYAALLDRADVDAVYLPLPPGLRAGWIERALRAGKHVLAEKPLTISAADTARLVALAERSGLVLLENVMFLQHPVHERVAALLAGDAIGRPRVFTAAFTIPPRPPDDIRLSDALGGGALLDNGVYPLRAAQLLFGSDWTVRGTVLSTDPRARVDLSGATLLSGPDGLAAQLTFGLAHGYTCRYEIIGERGRIALDRAFTPPADHPPALRLDRLGRVETVTVDAADQVARTLALFVAAIRGECDLTGRNRASVQQAVLVEAVRAAAAERRGPDRIAQA